MSTEQEQATPKTYAILQETSGEESESWLYFIKYQGNEEALQHLNKQLDMVDWYILDGYSTFDLETDFLVSEQTAKEMTKVDLNAYSFHRKFDGTLKKIDLDFRDKDKNSKKIKKAFKVLGYGKIEEFIDEEDVDPEDLVSVSQSDEESSESRSYSSESSGSSSSSSDKKSKKHGKLPSVTEKKIDIPRIAKMRQSKHKNKK
jgi:hypothetical protein